MPRKGHTEEQILQAFRQVEGGEKAVEICRKLASASRLSTPGSKSILGLD